GQVEELEAVNNPEDPSAGTRKVPFSRILYIEQDDFRDPPPPKYFRLSPGAEVRLRYAYIVKCTGVEKDASGRVVEVRCTYDPQSRGGDAKGRRVKGTIHWVSAAHAIDAEVRLYDTLFSVSRPDEAADFKTALNPGSLAVLTGAKLEPALRDVAPESRVQFERHGYFVADWKDHRPVRPVFNRTVGLRDTWAKIEKAS
ncbi:MAG: glutamine--tRNA ligase, partial [Candidatus Rokuibacteriota bacterium]